MWAVYSRLLSTRPYTTNTITAGIISFTGDTLAQAIERRHPNPEHDAWNPQRSVALGLWGLTVGGVPMVAWFGFLDRTWPLKSLSHVVSKVMLNQCGAAPVVNSLFFGWCLWFMEAQTSVEDWLAKWRAKLQHDLAPTMVRSFALWAPLHVFGFKFVPPQYRVLYLSVGVVGWSTYLSIVGHRKQAPVEALEN